MGSIWKWWGGPAPGSPRVQVGLARRCSACLSSPCVPRALGHSELVQKSSTCALPSKSPSGLLATFHGLREQEKMQTRVWAEDEQTLAPDSPVVCA